MLNISFAFAFFRNIRSIRKLTYKTFIDFIINIIFSFLFSACKWRTRWGASRTQPVNLSTRNSASSPESLGRTSAYNIVTLSSPNLQNRLVDIFHFSASSKRIQFLRKLRLSYRIKIIRKLSSFPRIKLDAFWKRK